MHSPPCRPITSALQLVCVLAVQRVAEQDSDPPSSLVSSWTLSLRKGGNTVMEGPQRGSASPEEDLHKVPERVREGFLRKERRAALERGTGPCAAQRRKPG